MPTRPTKVTAHFKTDVGMIREHNEDSAHVDPQGNFFIVADGMGGHAAGEVASAMAVDEMKASLLAARPQIEKFAQSPTEEQRKALVTLLETSVQKAHQAVFERGGREPDKKGMGTTLEVVLVADGEAFVAHVGDSRTYLLRSGAVAQVTTDHTVAEVLVIEGKLTAEEARLSPLRTILVNAIGVSPDVGVELAHIRLRRNDKLLLCSDGLHDYFPSDAELGELLGQEGGEKGLERLVNLAKERGGHDNITGILVEVTEGNPSMDEEAEEVRRMAQDLDATQSLDDKGAVPETVGDEPTMPQDGDPEPAKVEKAAKSDKPDKSDKKDKKDKKKKEKAEKSDKTKADKDKEARDGETHTEPIPKVDPE